MIDKTEKTHSKSANAQRDTTNLDINQATKTKILAKILLPQKIPKPKILNPKKSFDHPCYLKSGVAPAGTKATKISKIY